MDCPNCLKENKDHSTFCRCCSTKLKPSDFDLLDKSLNPLDLSFCMERADVLVKERKFNDALEYFSKAIELDPSNSDIYNKRGDCYSHILCCQRLGFKYEEALQNFLIAEKLNPTDTSILINKGRAEIGLKKYEDALDTFNIILKKDPVNINALTDRAFIKMVTGDFQGVKKDTAKVFKLNPAHSYSLYIYGTSLVHQRNFADGVFF